MTTRNIFFGTTSQGKISYDTISGNFTLGNSNTDLIHLNTNKNLGIGFTVSDTPIYRLDVTGGDVNTTGSYRINGLEVLSSGGLGTGITQAGPFDSLVIDNDLTVDGNTLYVDSIGNQVGIGTTAPTETLEVNGNTLIQGDLTVNGTLVTFNTENVTIEDPLIKQARGNVADTFDIGHYGLYNDGTSKYAGLFRDASDNTFKFFTGTTIEPTTTIDTNPLNGYTTADILVSNIDASSATITSNLTVDTNTLIVNASSDAVGINKAVPVEALDVVGNIGISGNIIPTLDAIFDLGTTTLRFRDLYLSNNTLHIGEVQLGSTSTQLSVTGSMIVTDDIDTSTDYNISGTQVLSSTTLGSGVVNSSLTSIGSLTDLTVVGDYSSTSGSITLIGGSLATINGQVLATNGNVTSTNGTVQGNDVNSLTDYNIGSTQVLSSTTLGETVVNSSLTSVGTLGTLTVTGDADFDTDTLYIDASANSVGIGTTTPSFLLDVSGDINFEGDLIQNGSIVDLTVRWETEGSNIYNSNIDSGNVGIGTTNPVRALDVIGSQTRPLRIETTNTTQNGILFANDTGTGADQWQFRFDKSDIGTTAQFRINHLGDGIGFWDALILNRTANNAGYLQFGDIDDTCNIFIKTGDIGIGTTEPTSSIDIVADTDNQNDELSTHGIRIQTGTTGQSLMMGYDSVDDISYINSGDTNGNTTLSLQTRGGSIGMGTITPSSLTLWNTGNSLGGHTCAFAGERTGTITVQTSYSYGNGSSASLGIAMPFAGTVIHLSISTSASESGTVTLFKNGSTAGDSVVLSAATSANASASETFVANDVLGMVFISGSLSHSVATFWVVFD